MRVLVTSGGTRVPIDDVRHIGNDATGRTGRLIAEEFARAQCIVTHLRAKHSASPFLLNDFDLRDPTAATKVDKQITDIKNIYERYVDDLEYKDFEHYHNYVKHLLSTNMYDIAVFNAAVSDYSPQKQDGKISSDQDNLIINLKKLPKVINSARNWSPAKTIVVGFKLLVDEDIEQLIKACNKQIESCADISVGNLMSDIKSGSHTLYVVDKNGTQVLDNGSARVNVYNLVQIIMGKIKCNP